MKSKPLSKRQMAQIHPQIPEAHEQLQQGRVSRREFLQLATLLGMPLAAARLAAPPTKSAKAAPRRIQHGANPRQSWQGTTIVRGGTWRSGMQIRPVIDHPARLSWVEASNIVRQVGEYLTQTGADNIARPYLLKNWQASEDLKTWTLNLRQGIKFNNGDELTADDLIFTFGEWLDPDVGSSMLSVLSYLGNIDNVEKVDEYTIRLYLQRATISLPYDLYHYPAIILHRNFAGDYLQQPVGTGAFTLHEFVANTRAILRRRTDYWQNGIDGLPLPYLDELIYTDMTQDEAVSALLSNEIDTMYAPRLSDWQTLKDDAALTVYPVSTSRGFIIKMRVDRAPWNDVRVRNALKKCLDREAILQFAHAGEGDHSIDAHIAPAHPTYCRKAFLAYHPEGARRLLAEAGYPNGIAVTLAAKNDAADSAIAAKLKELALPGGFDITLDITAPAGYWDRWTEVDLGITEWASRPLAITSLRLAYTQSAIGNWNETRWVDDEFEQILVEAEGTLDLATRSQLICQLEEIMQNRGPIAHAFWPKTWNITRSEFVNVEAHSSSHDLLYKVRKGGTGDQEILNNKLYLPLIANG